MGRAMSWFGIWKSVVPRTRASQTRLCFGMKDSWTRRRTAMWLRLTFPQHDDDMDTDIRQRGGHRVDCSENRRSEQWHINTSSVSWSIHPVQTVSGALTLRAAIGFRTGVVRSRFDGDPAQVCHAEDHHRRDRSLNSPPMANAGDIATDRRTVCTQQHSRTVDPTRAVTAEAVDMMPT